MNWFWTHPINQKRNASSSYCKHLFRFQRFDLIPLILEKDMEVEEDDDDVKSQENYYNNVWMLT